MTGQASVPCTSWFGGHDAIETDADGFRHRPGSVPDGSPPWAPTPGSSSTTYEINVKIEPGATITDTAQLGCTYIGPNGPYFGVHPAHSGEVTATATASLGGAHCRGAIITFAAGQVSVRGEKAGVGDIVVIGDELETHGRTRVELKLEDTSLVRIGPNSKIRLNADTLCKAPEDRRVSSKLVIGNIWAKIAHFVGGEPKFEVVTGDAGGGVRGGIGEFGYDPVAKRTLMRIDEGYGFLRNLKGTPKRSVRIPAGYCSAVTGAAPPRTPYRCQPFFHWEK